MPLQSRENRIEAAVLTLLQGIGTPAPSWLTAPTVSAGQPPLDALTQGNKQYVYLEYIRTVWNADGGGTAAFEFRATWHAWVVVTSTAPTLLQQVKNLYADCRRALFAPSADVTIRAAGCDKALWPGILEMRPDLAKGATQVGIFELAADYTVDRGVGDW